MTFTFDCAIIWTQAKVKAEMKGEPPTVYTVEWNDFEGNQHQREFDTLEDAQLEAAYLEEKFDYVEIRPT